MHSTCFEIVSIWETKIVMAHISESVVIGIKKMNSMEYFNKKYQVKLKTAVWLLSSLHILMFSNITCGKCLKCDFESALLMILSTTSTDIIIN